MILSQQGFWMLNFGLISGNHIKPHITTWNDMKSHEITWNYMKSHEITYNYMKLYKITENPRNHEQDSPKSLNT